mgnify:CR=1 FL=1
MDIEKAQLTNEEIDVDISKGKTSKNCDIFCPSMKWIFCYIICGCIGFYIFGGFSVLYGIIYSPNFNNTLSHVNYTSDIDYDYSSLIAASSGGAFPRSHGKYHKTCDDYDYGCCHIYFHCSIENGYLDYKKYTVSKYKKMPKDVIHSNCPSLDDLIHEWNEHYKSDTPCEDTEFGCCPSINTACDSSLREKRGNDEDTVDYYKEHVAKVHKLRQAKKDNHGSNCIHGEYSYQVYKILNGWENNYPEPDDGLWMVGVVFIIIICGLWSLDGAKREGKPSRRRRW